MNPVKIKVRKLSSNAIIPFYAHKQDAGMDIFSSEELLIPSGERRLVHTGISMELPQGFVALVWDKSGLALKNGIKILGGVIEHTYRGEYCIILLNTSKEDFKIIEGQKIAQILLQKIYTAEIEETTDLSETERGSKGFGSTGL